MSKNIWKLIFIVVSLTTIVVWLIAYSVSDSNLKVVTCDVGQGDASIIVKGSTQVVIDGGANSKIIDCLSEYVPFWDRTIEAVILTHPQKDHFGGLIDVFETYQVNYFLANRLDSSSQEYRVLKNRVGGSSTTIINPTSGMGIRVGMIYLDILHPSEEFVIAQENAQNPSSNNEYALFGNKQTGVLGAFTSKLDPNLFSIVVKLSYKDFTALFTGDIDPKISDTLANQLISGTEPKVNYIKIPHHGSKNGISEDLLKVTLPDVAVISVGKDNSYGHPNKEILDMLKKYNVPVYRTDEKGNVVVETDGINYWTEN